MLTARPVTRWRWIFTVCFRDRFLRVPGLGNVVEVLRQMCCVGGRGSIRPTLFQFRLRKRTGLFAGRVLWAFRL